MKTYEVVVTAEVLITVKVRAKNADEANELALERAGAQMDNIARRRKGLAFGDHETYVPARDE